MGVGSKEELLGMREWMFGYYGNEKKKTFGSCYEHCHAKGMGTGDRFCRIYSDEHSVMKSTVFQ